MEFKVIKLDRKRNNVVVSRRAVLEETAGAEREQLLASLQEGAIVKGIVKNITDYGAFVDLGGIDGLLHITDLAWRRVKHPSEVLNVGDEVTAKVLKFDSGEEPRLAGPEAARRGSRGSASRAAIPQGTRLFGKVTNLTDYGAFVEVESGIEGLVHVSEMDWTNKNVHPSKVVQVGDEVEVMILEIDEERRRISLGMKQCMPNPWEDFAREYKKGDKVQGPDQVDHRLRRVRRPARRHRRPGAPVRPVLVARPARKRSRTSRRARKSRRWCCRSTSSASASRSASSSSRAIRSPTSSPSHEKNSVVTRHGEVGRRQGRGDRARRRRRGLPARLRVLARPRRGPAHAPEGRRHGARR